MRTCGWYPMKVLCSQEVVRHIAVGLYSVRALRRRLRLRCHGVSPACSSSKVFGRIRPGQKLLIFMSFHAVLFGNQHEMWSKQHNGKVRSVLSSSTLVVDRALAPHPWPAGSGLCGAPAKPALARG